MAQQFIYKNIGIEDEGSYGASVAGTANRLRVTSVTFGLDVTKELVESTIATSKGRDRMISRRNVIEGDIAGFGAVRELHHMFELANGVVGTSAALGATAAIITYHQNTTGNMLSKSVNVDRNNTQEKFSGVVATELELSFSDDLLEYSLSGLAKSRAAGTAMSDSGAVGPTVEPFSFADFTVTIHQGATYGAQAVTHKVNMMSLTYNTGVEGTYQSGSKNLSRVDPNVPTLEGSFTIFHEGTSWVDASYGASEFYIRLEGVLPSEGGLIGGVTPYLLRIDIPRAELTTNVRNYEQAALSVEEITFSAMADLNPNGTSALWRPQLTTGTVL